VKRTLRKGRYKLTITVFDAAGQREKLASFAFRVR
jgi:hypothetical protein